MPTCPGVRADRPRTRAGRRFRPRSRTRPRYLRRRTPKRNFPTRPLFGDTHLHTGWSFDAGTFGCRLTPSDAYRFARGEEIRATSGQPAKLSRPLDFLVVADHSENMGLFTDLLAGKPELLANRMGRRWYDMIQTGKGGEAAFEISFALSNGLFPKDMLYTPATPAFRSAWQGEIKAAEEYNEPGRFTAFIGFEWTSNTAGNNLHRNVIFRGNGAQAGLVVPYVTVKPFGSDNPEDLWKWMAATEKETGSEVLAIAHNGNLSNGTHVPDGRGLRQEDRQGLCRDARPVGTAL